MLIGKPLQLRIGAGDQLVVPQQRASEAECARADPVAPGLRDLLQIVEFGEGVHEALHDRRADLQPARHFPYAKGRWGTVEKFEDSKATLKRLARVHQY